MRRQVVVVPSAQAHQPGERWRREVTVLLFSLAMVSCSAKLFDSILPERNQKPIATFKITDKKPLGSRELKVSFDASASFDDSAIQDYIWDWGDASAVETLRGSAGQAITHTYLVANSAVTVKLVVRDDDGELSEATSARLLLNLNHTPVASFAPTAVSGPAPLVVTFSSSSSDPDLNETELLKCFWQFEDGGATETTDCAVIEHRYPNRGRFTVTLRVSDGLETSTPVYGDVRVE